MITRKRASSCRFSSLLRRRSRCQSLSELDRRPRMQGRTRLPSKRISSLDRPVIQCNRISNWLRQSALSISQRRSTRHSTNAKITRMSEPKDNRATLTELSHLAQSLTHLTDINSKNALRCQLEKCGILDPKVCLINNATQRTVKTRY